jgi:hypothetical protein
MPVGSSAVIFGCSPWFDWIFCAIGFSGAGADVVVVPDVGDEVAVVDDVPVDEPEAVVGAGDAVFLLPCAVVVVVVFGLPCVVVVVFGLPCVVVTVFGLPCVVCVVTVGREPVGCGLGP